MATLTLEIITPEGTALAHSAESVSFSSAQGQLTILPGHQPIMGQTQTGELTYKSGKETHRYAIDNGFFMLRGDKLSMLVEGAADSDKISLEAIKNAETRARKALENAKTLDPAEVEEFERIVRFAIAQRLMKERL